MSTNSIISQIEAEQMEKALPEFGPGDTVVTSDGAYPTFNYHVAGFGADLVKVPYAHDHEDLRALIQTAAQQDAKLVYFANPDNPMGTWLDARVIEKRLEDLPGDTVLALDEAYADTAPPEAIPRVLRTRRCTWRRLPRSRRTAVACPGICRGLVDRGPRSAGRARVH